MFEQILFLATSILGILMSISWLSQAYRIYQRKSSKDVSIIHISIFIVGTLCWLIYGIMLKDLPIILSFSIGFMGTLTVLILALIYR